MAKFPSSPFLTRDFSSTGGGIDFLGMRWVSLTLLAEHLIPGINNATSDVGNYCLATWIPWRFRQLCSKEADFRLSKFRQFQESLEVMISHTTRTDSPASDTFGTMNRGIGVQQKLTLPAIPSFANAKRKQSNSIFAAALYGPSLRFLGWITADAIAADGTSTQIPLVANDKDTELMVTTVQTALETSPHFHKVDTLSPPTITGGEIDDLGMHGLHPAYFRTMPRRAKRAVLAKLAPKDQPNGRTWTARLLVDTLRQKGGISLDAVRAIWHSGLLPNGHELRLPSPELKNHREQWAIFQCRQYQRWSTEQLMWCFENALSSGARLIKEIVDLALAGFRSEPGFPTTMKECVLAEAKQVTKATRFQTISEHWCRDVHGDHPAYIGALRAADEADECGVSIRMLARWWIQMSSCLGWAHHKKLFELGGEDRLSAKWFLQWLTARMDAPLATLLKDFFEQLIFSQHIRVALSRFDGQHQRLRFALGDSGIVPTRSVGDKLANDQLPGWTADRLWSFSRLLKDIDVIEENDAGQLGLGELADDL